MASLALGVKFNPASAGTADFVYASAVAGYVGPAATSPAMVDGKTYRYRAESADLTQWEFGYGIYTAATQTLARGTIQLSSTGAKVAFTLPPQVGVTVFPADMMLFDDAMSLTSAEKQQVQTNIAINPTFQTFLSGSGTYTTPTGVKWIRVRMVGGGGGGSGSGTASAGNGGGGGSGNTTFGTGTSQLAANGGGGGVFNGPSAGGSASLGSGSIGVALSGAAGEGANFGAQLAGGNGASSPFGGGGNGGSAIIIGFAAGSAPANTGAGGGGGGTGSTAGTSAGSGGSAAGYIDAIIVSPSATYPYVVGTAGTAGTAGIAGAVGGAGGSGGIWVEEHYS